MVRRVAKGAPLQGKKPNLEGKRKAKNQQRRRRILGIPGADGNQGRRHEDEEQDTGKIVALLRSGLGLAVSFSTWV